LRIFGLYMAKREPTSGLEPLTCSLRVINHALQGVAQACNFRISKPLSFPWLAPGCTVLRSRWCQRVVSISPSRCRSRVQVPSEPCLSQVTSSCLSDPLETESYDKSSVILRQINPHAGFCKVPSLSTFTTQSATLSKPTLSQLSAVEFRSPFIHILYDDEHVDTEVAQCSLRRLIYSTS
jgi:hypothetical protein